ncbi:MAG: adenine nucleotide alpha hydrolase [Chitinophagaceae bacterium]
MEKLKTYFNWSSGKDSALALHYLLQDKNYHVDHLLTSINSVHDRVSMHGLRRTLLEEQIRSIGIESSTIELPEQSSMEEYESIMQAAVIKLCHRGYKYAAFGDIFLEDLKKYREAQLEKMHLRAVFPLWKRDTRELLHEFVDLGFKAVVVCVNATLLEPSFAGRMIDKDFIRDLPKDVDPCGENGEFHSFCFDGPIFKAPVTFQIGEKIYREYQAPDKTSGEQNMGFWFCDLLPLEETIFSHGPLAF